MSLPHQCPKCELRFTWPTELDDHCRTDHPEFHHDYPAKAVVEEELPPPVVHRRISSANVVGTYWNER